MHLSDEIRARSPHQVLKARARDDWQGPFGFLRGHMKRWTVTFDENDPDGDVHGHQRPGDRDRRADRQARVSSRDSRCIPGEGPIPVECRAASCGTCWVGVLAGAEKLSPVVDRDERQRVKVFGYADTQEPQPIIRLACQAKADGAVSIVIPPWNGFLSGPDESVNRLVLLPAERGELTIDLLADPPDLGSCARRPASDRLLHGHLTEPVDDAPLEQLGGLDAAGAVEQPWRDEVDEILMRDAGAAAPGANFRSEFFMYSWMSIRSPMIVR